VKVSVDFWKRRSLLLYTSIVYLAEKNTNPEVAPKVNYGLLMENKPQLGPVTPGRVFAAAAVYRTLGLTTSVTDSQVWHTDSEMLLGLIIAHFYKNEFPESETQARGPLVDYRRLTSLLKRLGFWVDGQGGAGELTGQVKPDLNKASSGESAVLEQAQKVALAGNQAMLRAAQRKAWIQVYVKVGPSTIPEKEVSYAHALSSLCDSSTPKVVYLGCYEIEKGNTGVSRSKTFNSI
jgi:hypothetical protein